MTDPSQLAKLKDRIEKASGGDREIDTDLSIALFDIPEEAARSFPVAKIERSKTWSNHTIDVFPVGSLRATVSFEPPNYTASVDAALALVEKVLPGWFGDVHFGRPNDDGTFGATLESDNSGVPDSWTGIGFGKTPALSICAVLLKAMEASHERS